jgi:N,N'-diacetyllegionaminate synthase
MSRVLIIAEAGVNHNGSLDMAFRLVDAAKAAGADAVKFQTFKAERLVGRKAEKADYQKRATGQGESQLEMIRKLELGEAQHLELHHYCSERGIEFLSTAFDPGSIEFLNELGLSRWKIPSGEITNLPFLRRIASFGKPVLLSTGMAKLGEIEAALDALEAAGTPRTRVTVLHCTTEYPAPLEEVNLRAMTVMGRAFGVAYGYSDHTLGIAIPVAAATLGATVIEKHFTLDRSLEGPDHKASLEPGELAAMIQGIRDVETALGDGLKRVTPSEARNRPVARKSIVAAGPIRKGAVIRESDITAKRPGTGISPMLWDRVVGSTATSDYGIDEELHW